MAPKSATIPDAYHVMTKPVGPLCNLDCTYCFYLEKEKLYPDANDWIMPKEVLGRYIQGYIDGQQSAEITFAWQGGEPTIAGVDYFRTIVELQNKYKGKKKIYNALQTNGVLLDEEWGTFLAEHQFLVGLSIDGPEKLHDKFRVDKGQQPTFSKVMRGLDILRKHKVEFNTLTVVQRHNAKQPLEVYEFLKSIGSQYMQFIPIVERRLGDTEEHELELVLPEEEGDARVTPWSVRPDDFGEFLCAIYEHWVRNDVGKTFVQIFDVALSAYLGGDPGLCVFNETCGNSLAMEHNGDLYSCDHFVYPKYRLGSILNDSVADMVASAQQSTFGTDKRDTLPNYCQQCEVRFACNGDCPKHRFSQSPDGEEGLSYLCPAYRRFFNHVAPSMQYMVKEIHEQRPPANIMRAIQMHDLQQAGKSEPGPNDKCLCGSGRKFKKCCGK